MQENSDVTSPKSPKEAAIIPDEYRGRCRSWYKAFRGWSFVYWGLGIFITVGSVLVASKADFIGQEVSQVLGVLVAVAAAINTFYQPKSESERCRRAWIDMDCTIKRLEGVPEELITAARRAEDGLSGGATRWKLGEKEEDTHNLSPDGPAV